MARNDWYTVDETSNHFTVTKVDPTDRQPISTVGNTDVLPSYNIAKTNNQGKLSQCECWAGSKWCRHKKMVVLFQREGRINKGWLYQFDKEQWLPPLNLDLPDMEM